MFWRATCAGSTIEASAVAHWGAVTLCRHSNRAWGAKVQGHRIQIDRLIRRAGKLRKCVKRDWRRAKPLAFNDKFVGTVRSGCRRAAHNEGGIRYSNVSRTTVGAAPCMLPVGAALAEPVVSGHIFGNHAKETGEPPRTPANQQ
jgi:hypothetical protein